MKFRHVNVQNVSWLIPNWAISPFHFSKTLDDSLGKAKLAGLPVPSGERVYASVPFWVELNCRKQGDAELRIVTPSDDGVDLCGKLVIDTFSQVGDADAQIILPLNPFFKSYTRIDGTHTVYMHSFQTEAPLPYVGLTKRPWFKRFSQHVSSAKAGSTYLFHRAIREHHASPALHQIFFTELSQDGAFRFEEELVDAFSLYPKGLNMIPGGLAGLRYLASIGRDAKDAKERDGIVEDLAAKETLKGKPNPLCAARWQSDPDFVERVICGHSGRLTAEQVRTIRLHASFGQSAAEIARSTGARHERQVRNVLRGATYSRVAGGAA